MFEGITDDRIAALIGVPKSAIAAGKVKAKEKEGHIETDYRLRSEDAEEFILLLRQNKTVPQDFSCGLRWLAPGGDELMLLRMNGCTHRHGKTSFRCHVHRATAGAINAGHKPESHADATDEYTTIDGAKYLMVQMANIIGINAPPPQTPLFDNL